MRSFFFPTPDLNTAGARSTRIGPLGGSYKTAAPPHQRRLSRKRRASCRPRRPRADPREGAASALRKNRSPPRLAAAARGGTGHTLRANAERARARKMDAPAEAPEGRARKHTAGGGGVRARGEKRRATRSLPRLAAAARGGIGHTLRAGTERARTRKNMHYEQRAHHARRSVRARTRAGREAITP